MFNVNDPKDSYIRIRLSAAEKEIIKKRAKEKNTTQSNYLRSLINGELESEVNKINDKKYQDDFYNAIKKLGDKKREPGVDYKEYLLELEKFYGKVAENRTKELLELLNGNLDYTAFDAYEEIENSNLEDKVLYQNLIYQFIKREIKELEERGV